MSENPVESAERLTTAFEKMTDQMSRLSRGQLASKRVVRWLIISVALDIILSFSLAFLVVASHSDSVTQDNAIHSSDITACNIDKHHRTEAIQVLHALINLPAITHPEFQTRVYYKEQQAQYKVLNAQINTAFALRNCQKLYSQK